MQFEGIKKGLGFGCMRLPMKDGEVEYKEFSEMVDAFLESGFNYFDTAHGYLQGKSETALRDCLAARHPRDSFLLANKLSVNFFETEEDIRPFFEKQLELCGVEYFDIYLMHAQNAEYYKKYSRTRAYEIAAELKAEGKIKHIGISFHDKAAVLDKILTEHPEIELVQIQFNYVDYDDPAIESAEVYRTCVKHGKPAIIMEPVKGGVLANLPEDIKGVFDALNGGSPASYAIRYAAGFPGVALVLSGMSSMEQLTDNIGFMSEFKPLDKKEAEAVAEARARFRRKKLIGCTACRYCVDGCPKNISIPDLFSCLNAKEQFSDWNSDWSYSVYTQNRGRASDCIKCGKCEEICPQRLKIRELLSKLSMQFDGQD